MNNSTDQKDLPSDDCTKLLNSISDYVRPCVLGNDKDIYQGEKGEKIKWDGSYLWMYITKDLDLDQMEKFKQELRKKRTSYNTVIKLSSVGISTPNTKKAIYASIDVQNKKLGEFLAGYIQFCKDKKYTIKGFTGHEECIKRILYEAGYKVEENGNAAIDSHLSKGAPESVTFPHPSIQPRLTIPQTRENNPNYFANAVLDVIGRGEQKTRLKGFLECDKNVAWFQLAGVAGQGKSRLAYDLIKIAEKLGFRAGFLTENDIQFFRDQWKDWQPDKPYLLIFDYVIGREEQIKPIFQILVSNQDSNEDKYRHKIRILLVERQRWDQGSEIKIQRQNDKDRLELSMHIGDKAPWFLNLCERNDLEGEHLKPCRFEDGVEELKKLDQEDLVTIVKQLSGKELTLSDDALKQTLERIDDTGRPLYAYLLAQQLTESEEDYQSWTKIDLLNYQLVRDKRRWEQAFNGKAPTWGEGHPAMKLALLATIVRQVNFEDEIIKSSFGEISVSLGREAIAITSSYLINDDNNPHKIYALQPDLLGEWFVLFCFYKRLKFEELLNLAWEYSPDETAIFLQRITQDFINLSEKYTNWDLTEKLLAYVPSQEKYYQALANVAIVIADKLYRGNLTIPSNIIATLEYAADLSDTVAMNYLGSFYHQGISIEKNLEKGVYWHQRAADKGNSIAMVSLGLCYQKGKGVEQNWDEAFRLYRQAVDLGNSQAMFNLGICYERGEGVEQNWDEAIRLYRQAVDLGNSQAMVNLGVCYKRGERVEQNWDEAIGLYRQAVNLGDSLAMANLGSCYEKGEGVEQSWDEAVRLYRQAIKLGNSQAMFNLGLCYEIGKGVEQNWAEAVRLYRQAVDLGNSDAIINLGVCYQKGEGVEQNWAEAIRFYRQAIDLDNSQAMFNLGLCYERGEGVEQNWDEAVRLYQQAAKAGKKNAIDHIQNNLLLQNFLGRGNYKNYKTVSWTKNRYAHSDGAPVFDPPILTGNWKQFSTEEIKTCLDKIITPLDILELTDRLGNYMGQYARLLPLNFYKNCHLVDIQLYNPSNNDTLIFSAILNTERAILLNGKSNVIHSVNRHLLAFNDKKNTLAYLQFFCSYAQTEHGPFQIITKLNEISFDEGVDQLVLDKITASLFSPRHIAGNSKNEGWQEFEACVLYGDALLASTFKLFQDGRVSMEDDNCIIDNLPILQRRYNGIFRTPLRPFNS
ncbi:SEL1-like repeat protein [Nitrosomonas europaea]|uniref:SEL1-like repeat protein n=1 Tax=Nitrosomonas europaea TaxID=915 RepID=UPI0032651A16